MTDNTEKRPDVYYGQEDFILVRRDGAVAELIFNRPERLNALPMRHTEGMEEALGDLSADDEIKVIILKGAGRAFSTGGDMKWVGTQYTDDVNSPKQVEGERKRKTTQRHYLQRDEWHLRGEHALLNCTKVVIAEVRGYALGVAFEYLLAADIIICEEGAVFGFPPARMAGVAGNALLWMLRLGPALSAEMTLMGRYITAEEGHARNFVNRVVPADQLDDTVRAAAEAVCLIPGDGLAVGKLARKMAWAALGMQSSSLESAMTHTLAVQLRMDDDDWNLLRERQEFGAKEAYKRRDARFQDPLLRFNPDTPKL